MKALTTRCSYRMRKTSSSCSLSCKSFFKISMRSLVFPSSLRRDCINLVISATSSSRVEIRRMVERSCDSVFLIFALRV